MKINSKILGVLIALIAVCMAISAASAVDLANDFKNDNFAINVASGTDFNETVNIATGDIELVVFGNSGKNSADANSIIYFKDSTADKKEISGFINDLEKYSSKVDETDKYVVLKNTHSSHDFDVSEIGGIFDFANNMVSSDGINLSADGNSVSFSENGLEISDAGGQNVSITSDGVSVSGDESSDNATVNVSGDLSSNIGDSVYSIYLKNSDNKVIVISGNDLELLKAMAETVTFNEN